MVDIVNIGMRVDSSSVRKGRKDLDEFGDQSVVTKRQADKLKKSIRDLAAAYLGFQSVKIAIQAHREFTKSISELSAITGAAGKELEFYKDQAISLGASTTFSAQQVAQSFKLIASAMPELLESREALATVTKEVLTLAEASGMQLPMAATALGGAMNQFKAGADEASRFINVMAAGAKFGASEINETAEALKNSGAVAASLGISFEEVNAAIQAMAAVSIKGAEAGTGLRSVMLKLATQANDKINPEIVGLSTALKNLSALNLSTSEKTKLFGLESITAATALLEQADAVGELTKSLTDTSTAYEQASINTDNLEGDILAMNSSWSAAALIVGETFDPTLRVLTQTMTGLGKILQITAIEFDDLIDLMGSYMAQSEAAISLDFDRFKMIGTMRKEERISVDKKIQGIIGEVSEYKKLAIAQEKLADLQFNQTFNARLQRKRLKEEIELRKLNIKKIEDEAAALQSKALSDAAPEVKIKSFFTTEGPSDDSKKASQAIVDSLKLEADTWGMTSEQVAIHRAGLLNGGNDYVTAVYEQAQRIKALRAGDEAKEAADAEIQAEADKQQRLSEILTVKGAEEVERIKAFDLTENEREIARFESKKTMLAEYFEQEKTSKEEQYAILEALKANHDAKIKSMDQSVAAGRISATGSLFSALGSLQDKSSKAGFERAKKLNIAATIANTAAAIMVQAKDGDGFTAWARMSAMAVAGAAQLAAIKRSSFGGGGSASSVGGGGGFGGGSPQIPQQQEQVQPQTKVILFVQGGGTPDMDDIMNQISTAFNDEDRQPIDMESRFVQNIIEVARS